MNTQTVPSTRRNERPIPLSLSLSLSLSLCKRCVPVCLCAGFLFFGGLNQCVAQSASAYVPDAVLVTLDAAHDTDAEVTRLAAVGPVDIRIPDIHVMRVRLPVGETVLQGETALMQYPEVRHAEPDWYVHGASTPPVPDDTWYKAGDQFAPQQVQADSAWSIWNPIKTIIVADLGTGVDFTHPDLTNKMYRSGGAVVGYNVGIYNLYSQDDVSFVDDNGHNTMCAGVIAAQINNGKGATGQGVGIAGIAGWDGVKGDTDTSHTLLMPVKVLDSNENGNESWFAEGITWAADNGANVISMSLGSYIGSGSQYTALLGAVAYAWGTKGCVLVAAAGNTHGSAPEYPAYFGDCISVAAVDRTSTLTAYSTWGSWVNVAAPGGDGSGLPAQNILSTWPQYATNPITHFAAPAPYTDWGTSPGTGYGYWYGTSFACPVVSGEAALMWAQNPNLTNQEIYNIITRDTTPVSAYNGHGAIGGGQVDVYQALQHAASGIDSRGELVEDSGGNWYGMTRTGGAYGGGTVFRLDPSGNLKVLHSFGASGDGAYPYGGLVFDAAGTFLWGTTSGGGTGAGTIFAVSPDGGTYNDEHNFNGADGYSPRCTLARGGSGFYGVTYQGGTNGTGVIFSIDSTPTFTLLYNFSSAGGTGAQNPYGGLCISGTDLWGATLNGGTGAYGMVYSYSVTSHALTPHVQFTGNSGASPGANPYSQLAQDASGNFYGTTYNGGSNGEGTLYQVSPAGAYTRLHTFGGTVGGYADGQRPVGRPALNPAGTALWGATQYGGASGYGMVWQVTISTQSETPELYFDGTDGGYGYSGLVYNPSDGYYYGTLQSAGAFGGGSIYRRGGADGKYLFQFGY